MCRSRMEHGYTIPFGAAKTAKYIFYTSLPPINMITFSYIVNTIPPLIYTSHISVNLNRHRTRTRKRRRRRRRRGRERTISLANLGVVPVQNLRTPSSVKILYAQWNELRYCVRASRDCIRVLITLRTRIFHNKSALVPSEPLE